MASLVPASHGLEAASLRRMLCTPVSDGELGVFLQPPGQLARPCCCWLLMGCCWLLWPDKAEALAFTSCWGGFRTLTLNFSFWVLRIYVMCKKPLEVVCYLPLFILSTMKLKLLCPFGNNECFVCENSICKKKINLESCFRIISNRVIWSFCHHNHFKKGKHKPKTLKKSLR